MSRIEVGNVETEGLNSLTGSTGRRIAICWLLGREAVWKDVPRNGGLEEVGILCVSHDFFGKFFEKNLKPNIERKSVVLLK